MREHFVHEMTNLKQQVATLSADAERALDLAIKSVIKRDDEIAHRVLEGDILIDMEEIKIESSCLEILALYQPVASDLRTIITFLKINNEIERAADFAVKIAERAISMNKYDPEKVEQWDFFQMANIARQMLRRSLDAMVYHDTIIAYDVIKRDDELDELHKNNYYLAEDMIIKHPAEAGYYMACLTVSSCLERIGDIATNICEDVVYLQQGRIVRHARKLANNSECTKNES